MFRRFSILVFLTFSLTLLSACETADERAQKYFEKGTALLEEGEVERALLEFRNVLKLNELHKEARLTYAQVEEGRGNTSAAYGQYLRLVEQYPENLEGRRALARMASTLNNWEEVERHVTVAQKLAPADPMVLAIRAGLDYRNALRDEDRAAVELAVKASETLISADPDLSPARRVVIDDLLRRQDWAGALAAIDAGLVEAPEERFLYIQRLAVLEKLERDDGVEAQLKEMALKYPDEGIHQALIKWYLTRERKEDAEAYLRERIDSDAENPDARLELVAFLAQTVSRQAALDEIDQILTGTTGSRALFRSVRSGLEFDAGNREAAIIEMEDILKDADPSEETDRIKIALAKMLIRTGNSVGARARVEEVLERDATQINALKMKAGWLIEDDNTGDALVELRRALDQQPRDAETLTLMALAHERAGNRDLMGEMLALAVEASGSAPGESLRYAQFLLRTEKLLSAEDVLQDALRLKNTNPALLGALGNVYIRMEDWPRTQAVINTLERIDTELAQNIANELTARKLAGQNREGELQAFLGGLAEGESGLQAAASIIRLRLAQGDVSGALEYIAELLADNPENPALRFVQAGILAIDGKPEEAVAIFRDLLSDYPQDERVWLALYNLHRSRGEEDVATAVLVEARTAVPQSANLKWVEAGEAERSGDIEAAIAIYEDLYAANSNSLVVANNLASLISSYREDDESLQRAYAIARRLRGTDIAAFQDTYGWIAHRLGNSEEALGYLEPAGNVLLNDPVVQYHLAENYLALGRDADALVRLRKVAELVQDGRPRPPFMDRVEAEIARLAAIEGAKE